LKCNECGKRVKDDPASKIKHIIKFHPDIFVSRALPGIMNPDLYFELGQQLGKIVKRELRQLYGTIGQSH
jgi:hypothetical protein